MTGYNTNTRPSLEESAYLWPILKIKYQISTIDMICLAHASLRF